MNKTYADTLTCHVQVRVGKRGKSIVIRKFRTMRRGAHAGFREWAAADDDPRITRFGRFLRRTHLDEVPQIWNLLKGELRPVGLRPRVREAFRELPEEVQKIYLETGPGAWPIEYACKHFPPTPEELAKTAKEFFDLWKKSPNMAYWKFFWRSLRNVLTKSGYADKKMKI